jgi:hypothetical protein
LPQVRHKLTRVETDNGGFLRVSEESSDVAKTAPWGRFVSVTVLQVIDIVVAIPAGLEPATYCLEGNKWRALRLLTLTPHITP